VTISLNVADPNLNPTRIIWEASGQEPAFGGQSYTFNPGPAGAYWVEAEVQWPDGRRAFATNAIVVSTNAPPVLTHPQKASGAGFSFVLAGAPQATFVIQASSDLKTWTPIATNSLSGSGTITINDPQAAAFSRRYYRAVQTQ
jgi:hypothetical protein